MRSIVIPIVCGLLLAGTGLLTGGCEDKSSSNWEFKNLSSYRVYVAPNGQSWSPATVGPNNSIEVDYNGEHIQYIYNPSDKVAPQQGDDRTITFYNR